MAGIPSALGHEFATVDMQHLPGHITRTLSGEVHAKVGDVVDMAQAALRHMLGAPGEFHGIARVGGVRAFGVDHTGRDGIRGDAKWPEFEGQHLCEGMQCGLARCNMRAFFLRVESGAAGLGP